MKNINTQLIVSGIVTILLSAGIIYTVYTVFQTKKSNQEVVNFINSQISASQKNAPAISSQPTK